MDVHEAKIIRQYPSSIKKAVLLSGGKGTRLNLFTRRVTNKHLALVYNRVMIEYPLSMLSQAGITDVAVITSNHHAGALAELIGDGREFGFENVAYFVQTERLMGIAGAFKLIQNFMGEDNFVMILGDNFFEMDISKHTKQFTRGANIFLKAVHDPERFGVAEVEEDRVISLQEKPKYPRSNLAVTGLYFFDNTAFEKAENLKKSARGELEIVDVLAAYMEDGDLKSNIVNGYWSDMGVADSLLRTANWVSENHDNMISSGRFAKYRFLGQNNIEGDYL